MVINLDTIVTMMNSYMSIDSKIKDSIIKSKMEYQAGIDEIL